MAGESTENKSLASGDLEKNSGADAKSMSAYEAGETTDSRSSKETEVIDACENGDVDSLISLATSNGGLVSDELRRLACTCPFIRRSSLLSG